MNQRIIAGATLAASVAGAAVLGSRFSPADPETASWYSRLKKSPANPPDAVFAPVWTALYAAMAVSAYRIWSSGDARRGRALSLWGAQLALNAAWNPIFFGARKPKAALADLLALFVVVAAYTSSARKIDRPAAWLMAPYLAWLGFAGLLNAEIVRRND